MNIIALDRVVGFILNIPSEYRLGPVQLPLRRKHWITIRSIRGTYYNLDSKLDTPEMIGKDSQLINYFRNELLSREKELFIVVTQEVERTRGWCLDAINCGTAPLVKSDSIESTSQTFDETYEENHKKDHDLANSVNKATEIQESLSFDTPGLHFIDQEPSSVSSIDNSRDGELDKVSEANHVTSVNDTHSNNTIPNGTIKK